MNFIQNFKEHFSVYTLKRSSSSTNAIGERKTGYGPEEQVEGIIVATTKPREAGANVIRETSEYIFYTEADVTTKAKDIIERGAEVFEVIGMQKKYDFGKLSHHAHYLKLII